MKNPTLGCLSASGIFGAILTVIIVAGFALAGNGILFSPGALNAQAGPALGGATSHADIASHCSQCHVPFWDAATMNDRCVACHTDVSIQLKDPSTLHGGTPTLACRSCHPDHRGPNAPLTNINHDLFIFKLTGKHANVTCTACHINNVFKGTPTDCFSCHQKNDTHNGQFGTDCGSCHSTSGWKPANFDHSKSGFPLTGGHASVACAQCHTGGTYNKISTACVTCHALPVTHTSMSTDCTQCHTTASWTANFNHPGGNCGDQNCANHERATCAECHPVNYSTYVCTPCHDSNNPGGGDRGGGGGD
jgi:hypothetical protein